MIVNNSLDEVKKRESSLKIIKSIIENEVKEIDAANSNYSGEYDAILPFLSADEKEDLFVAVTNVKITDEKERLHSKIIAHRKQIEGWEFVVWQVQGRVVRTILFYQC